MESIGGDAQTWAFSVKYGIGLHCVGHQLIPAIRHLVRPWVPSKFCCVHGTASWQSSCGPSSHQSQLTITPSDNTRKGQRGFGSYFEQVCLVTRGSTDHGEAEHANNLQLP